MDTIMDIRRAAGPDMSAYPGINMVPTLGPLFWGTLVSMIFTGIAILQAYHYFPSKDRPMVQLIALSMLLLDLVSSALAAQGLNYYLLPQFGSTVPLGHLVPTLAGECIATTCIIAISQLYFSWQVYALAQKPFIKYIVSGTVVALSLLAFAGGLACSIVMFVHDTNILGTRNRIFNVTAAIAKAPAALADIVATSALCYSLGYAKTGIRATDSVIKTLIGFSIQRGLFVTLIQTGFLIMFYTSSAHLYWLGVHVNVTRVYANTFFAMLNGREALKKELEFKSIATTRLETCDRTHPDNAYHGRRKEACVEIDRIACPQTVWMNTVEGGIPANGLGMAQIQVDRKILVSDM